ncbi:MAG: PHP domain-containing protein [Lachnospiraceae bacterium]|nr:PHP domain-containing protein [Lachnospiraceae bacterium]
MLDTRFVDLHVHSTKSDGTYTPKDLVEYAIEKGLSAFALTDHDTVDGVEEAFNYAEKLREQYSTKENDRIVPEVIPGIEFSTEYQGKDVHIVGLYIDIHSPAFEQHLRDFVESRNVRNEKMCRSLQGIGMDITYEKLLERFPGAVITRAHYAKYMLEKGYIKNMAEAFERYIGDYSPHYIPREKVTPEQAIQLTLEAGGIPILAHPILYHLSDARLEELVVQLKSVGLVGIEAIYSTYAPAEERQIRRLAEKYDLLLSGGSDFHGSNKPGLDLAVGYGKLFVPYEVLENIKAAHL